MLKGKGVRLYLMNQMGFSVLKAIAEDLGSAAVESVIGAQNPAVQEDYFEQIKSYCTSKKISFLDRKDAGAKQAPATIYSLAIGWRWMLPVQPGKLIVLHDSLLPRYRGFNPLVSALLNKDSFIGVTALIAAEEYDTGPIVAQAKVKISYPIQLQAAIEALAPLYAKIAKKIVSDICSGKTLKVKKQIEASASYSLWRDDEDYRIDWNQKADDIAHFIRVVGFPYAGASALVDCHKARILAAESVKDCRVENRQPGKILFLPEGTPVVVCGKGLLKITKMVSDPEGKDLLPWQKFRTRFS